MYHLEVVDDCALILALLPAPRAVGHPIEAVQCVQIMYAHQAHNLWGLLWEYCSKEFQALQQGPQCIVSLPQLIQPSPYLLNLIYGQAK